MPYLFLLLLLCGIAIAGGENWPIDDISMPYRQFACDVADANNDGNDANDGFTWATRKQHLYAAYSAVPSGGDIYFLGWDQQLDTATCSKTIHLWGWDPNSSRIQVCASGTAKHCITLSGNGSSISDCTIEGTSACGATKAAVYIGASDCYIDNSRIIRSGHAKAALELSTGYGDNFCLTNSYVCGDAYALKLSTVPNGGVYCENDIFVNAMDVATTGYIVNGLCTVGGAIFNKCQFYANITTGTSDTLYGISIVVPAMEFLDSTLNIRVTGLTTGAIYGIYNSQTYPQVFRGLSARLTTTGGGTIYGVYNTAGSMNLGPGSLVMNCTDPCATKDIYVAAGSVMLNAFDCNQGNIYGSPIYPGANVYSVEGNTPLSGEDIADAVFNRNDTNDTGMLAVACETIEDANGTITEANIVSTAIAVTLADVCDVVIDANLGIGGVASSLADVCDTALAALADTNELQTNITLANINGQVDTALTDYNAPTKAELDAAEVAIEADIAALDANLVADVNQSIEYYGLDHLLKNPVADLNDLSTEIVTNTIFALWMSGGDANDWNYQTDNFMSFYDRIQKIVGGGGF